MEGPGSEKPLIAASITINGPLTAISAARRGAIVGGLPFMLVMIVDVLGFAVFVAAAVAFRRRREAHRRLMLLGTSSLLPPAVFRWPLVGGSPVTVAIVLVAFLAVAPLGDLLAGRRIHPVSLWGGVALLASVPIRLVLSRSTVWLDFATWLIR
jgi:hypothetical protein